MWDVAFELHSPYPLRTNSRMSWCMVTTLMPSVHIVKNTHLAVAAAFSAVAARVLCMLVIRKSHQPPAAQATRCHLRGELCT
eukprot:4884948-Amphidinium_carterae.2